MQYIDGIENEPYDFAESQAEKVSQLQIDIAQQESQEGIQCANSTELKQEKRQPSGL
jgi:hypothetical protein